MRVVVRTDNPTGVDRLMTALKSVRGVDAVYLREQNATGAVIEIDSAQKPQTIYQALRQAEGLSLDLISLNASELSIYVR